jgi:cytochrome P450
MSPRNNRDQRLTPPQLTFLYTAARILYNLFFHPLARFPGPVLWRATRLGYVVHLLRGTLPRDVLPLHLRYGPVVRIAPNELSVATPEAWREIYGFRTGDLAGREEMCKDSTLNITSGSPSILSDPDRERHAALRRQLAHGFSDRGMKAQEPIFRGHVDLLIRRLYERCVGTVTDMTAWYNFTTFDIIGDLAFGEPFGYLEKSEYRDYSVEANNISLKNNNWLVALQYMGLDFLKPFVMKYFLPARNAHFNNTIAKLKRRMNLGVERPDLIEGLLKKQKDGYVSSSIHEMV